MNLLPSADTPPYGPPLRAYPWQPALALPIFAGALGMYGLTLAPTVVAMFDDSLELQLVTYQLGIVHPTGYPLYTLLGWLFTRLPVGDVAYRVNLMSAIFAAATVALVYLIGLELASQPSPPSDQAHLDHARWPWANTLAALIGALTLAVSPVFWSQATLAEVYTLNAAFVAAILWLSVRIERQAKSQTHPYPEKSLLALAFLLGLSLTHHRSTVLLLPAIIFYLWRPLGGWRHSQARESQSRSHLTGLLRAWVKLAAAFSIPLLLYLYIPLRGHVGSLDGTYSNTLAGFWQHITASGYRVFIFENPFGSDRGASFYFALFLTQFGPLNIAAGLVGLGALRSGQHRGLTLIAFGTYFAFNVFYRVADVQVFFIPCFLIWALWIGAAAGWLLTGSGPASTRPVTCWRLPLSLAITLLLVGQSAVVLRDNWPTLDRSKDWAVYDYGLDVMQQPLEKGAAIVGIMGEVTLVRYFQITTGLRPDLLPISADRETERLATVAGLLNEGQTVYLTRELPGAPERWSLSAVGPLIQVNPRPLVRPPDAPLLAASSPIPQITLYSYAITRLSTHHSPPPVRLALTWQATAPITREIKVSARLTTAEGQPVAQTDAIPVHFAYPTTAWRPGEFITDVYDLALPSPLPASHYVPMIIFYEPVPGAPEVGRLTLPPVYLP
jgi:hypothetical protein